MANTYRFYRSPRIGSGTHSSPYRSDLTRFIPGADATSTFWDWLHEARPVRYALAYCDSAVHAAIDTDGQSTALSAELADPTSIADWLDNQTALNLPAGIQTLLESDGMSLAWLAAQTTRRQLLNYISRLHVITQDLERLTNSDSLLVFAAALTANVNTLSAATRNKVATWMQNKGLDSSWITGTTKVRQVIQYILENISWPTLSLGPVTL